ncbi:GreA/GreB family elongation factor [Alkalimonas sp. MEB108]|uniref:GreA/GreB family elongation factor n=1 Tax=Alkalimonas cellulosilytica TaxID=3058395 RepID=A0ABU7J2Z8_9GAMM|nr:GreA/GreB family elongation factor [Alkalimonas sp. MEB108]MEE2000881.1 GreA/GreB family elongation factor [Alkalimonas sp. MEB108]
MLHPTTYVAQTDPTLNVLLNAHWLPRQLYRNLLLPPKPVSTARQTRYQRQNRLMPGDHAELFDVSSGSKFWITLSQPVPAKGAKQTAVELDSPLGRALLQKKAGDQVVITLGRSQLHLIVLQITKAQMP